MLPSYLKFLQITGAIFLLIILVLGAASGDWAVIAIALVLAGIAFVSLREAKRRTRP